MNVNKTAVDVTESRRSVPGVSYRPPESFQPRANLPFTSAGCAPHILPSTQTPRGSAGDAQRRAASALAAASERPPPRGRSRDRSKRPFASQRLAGDPARAGFPCGPEPPWAPATQGLTLLGPFRASLLSQPLGSGGPFPVSLLYVASTKGDKATDLYQSILLTVTNVTCAFSRTVLGCSEFLKASASIYIRDMATHQHAPSR